MRSPAAVGQSLSETFGAPATREFPRSRTFRETGRRGGVSRPGPPRTPYSRTPIASIGRARSATDVATPIATIPSRTAPAMIPQ